MGNETFDIDEFKRRLERARNALLEAENYVYEWNEIEARKRSATPPETQG